MAQPYLVAMEHAEFHARDIIRKHYKNRPLGHIERQHKFTPPQPVLSCRSVNVDVSGTRTYRAMSANDIIDEQHKIIHQVYSSARNINSAPPTRSRATNASRPGSTPLKYLQVHGTSRPSTSLGVRPNSARKAAQLGLKKRPHTAETPRKSKPATQCFLKRNVDRDYELVNDAFVSVSGQLKQQWQNPEHHRLDEGIFVRGKKQQGTSSIDPKAGNQWLTFGGGQRAATAGVVDAFTAMKDTEEYYTIDGSTGSLVAKSLRPGDKIRVGVNGDARGQDCNINRWTRAQQDKLSRLGDDARIKPSEIVPLCWTDQVCKEDVKVLEPSTLREEQPRPNLCETHPVVFRKLIPDENMPPSRPHTSGERYTMKLRHRPRKGMDGVERESSRITSISLAKDTGGGDDDEAEKITYDDIIKMKVKSKPGTRESKKKSKSRSRSSSPKSRGKVRSAPVDVASQSNAASQVTNGDAGPAAVKMVNGTQQTPNVRPTTALSAMSQDYEQLDSAVNVVGVGPKPPTRTAKSGVPPPAGREGAVTPRRVMSAGRPPPARSSLHKTAAASGASIRSDTSQDHTEFIQISTQIPVKDKSSSSVSASPLEPASPAPGSAAIEHVREHNQTKFEGEFQEEKTNVSVEDTVAENTTPETPHATPEPPEPPVTEEVEEEPPPPPPPKQLDMKFAVNIPTADNLDSEANSVVGD